MTVVIVSLDCNVGWFAFETCRTNSRIWVGRDNQGVEPLLNVIVCRDIRKGLNSGNEDSSCTIRYVAPLVQSLVKNDGCIT